MKKPKIRFKGFTETWEQRKFNNLFVERRDKTKEENEDTLLSSAIDGMYLNSELFSHFRGSSTIGYLKVKKNDLILSAQNLHLGNANVNLRFESGIISPAYKVFNLIDCEPNYVQAWVKKDSTKNFFLSCTTEGASVCRKNIDWNALKNNLLFLPNLDEQKKIGTFFSKLDHLITLHQCKYFTICNKNRFAWEQRKLGTVATFINGRAYSQDELQSSGKYRVLRVGNLYTNYSWYYSDMELEDKYYAISGDLLYTWSATFGPHIWLGEKIIYHYHIWKVVLSSTLDKSFAVHLLERDKQEILSDKNGSTMVHITKKGMEEKEVILPTNIDEQIKIGKQLDAINNLITLHQHKLNILKGIKKYMIFGMLNIEGGKNMPELESIIEKNLIDQLVLGDSQWTYRPDLKSEKDLWDNFRYILEQNNKDRLNGQPLSDNEFEQVKNQLQFSSFYKAGEWLVGENGKVMVHVQRDTEKLHLVVMNHEHIAGGSSVYEVINQYSTLQSDKENGKDNNSRFDVTLMINGLPMIHIELKNKSHPYMEAFNQIKRYIGEGKFTGIFSAVQMFVVSNGVDTKYFSAASDTELNPKFMSGWLDEKNNPVTDYIDFAKSVLSIPQAHEMIARYTVLDEDSKRLILLRPYQIHAIEAIR